MQGVKQMSKLLGQVLMETGMVSIDDLNEALEVQKSSGQRLGDILINMDIITPEELQMALDFQDEGDSQ
jgi:type IV pilus assembly protein PilB